MERAALRNNFYDTLYSECLSGGIMYNIGVISDTHGILRKNVTDTLSACQAILHGGDIGGGEILKELKEIAPVYAVRGNVDERRDCQLPVWLSMELYGIRIFLIHNRRQIRRDISDRQLIIYGHSHKYEHIVKGTQTWLNPGGCGARRFKLPLTLAVISIEETGGPFQIRRLNLEVPPAGSMDFSGKTPAELVLCIMKDTDKGKPVQAMARKYQISEDLAARICRLYVTHPGVSADGILKKMGL